MNNRNAAAWKWILDHREIIRSYAPGIPWMRPDAVVNAVAEDIVRKFHSYDPDRSGPKVWIYYRYRKVRVDLLRAYYKFSVTRPARNAKDSGDLNMISISTLLEKNPGIQCPDYEAMRIVLDTVQRKQLVKQWIAIANEDQAKILHKFLRAEGNWNSLDTAEEKALRRFCKSTTVRAKTTTAEGL